MSDIDYVPDLSELPVPSTPAHSRHSFAMPDLKALGAISSENMAALQQSNNNTNIVNVSTESVQLNDSFNTGDYDAQARAMAGTAEHMKMVTMVQGHTEKLFATTEEFNRVAAGLANVRLPDTKVSIGGQKLECSSYTKQYAMEIDQGQYNNLMHGLIGPERMTEIHMGCKKSNMAHTPALWINQLLELESQKNYVYTLGVNEETAAHLRELESHMDAESRILTKRTLDAVLGRELAGRLERVADSARVSAYVMFIALIDRIVDKHSQSKTITPSTIWDKVTTSKKESLRPEVTAEYAERMKG